MLHEPSTNQFYLVGVVAAGIGCGGKVFPGMYTDVQRFMPWIQQNTN